MTDSSLLPRVEAVRSRRVSSNCVDGGSDPSDLGLEVLRAAVHAADESIVVTDAELDPPGPRIVYVNPAFTRLTGYTAEEAIGATPRLLQGPKTDRAVLDCLRGALTTEQTFRGEAVNYRKDGSEFIMEWTVTALRNPAGDLTHWVAIQRDVTALREAEHALQASEKQFRLMADSMPQVIWTTDAKGGSDYLNERWYEVTGASRDKLSMRAWVDYLHPDDVEKALAEWNKAVREASTFEAEYRLWDKPSGCFRWQLMRGRPVQDSTGRTIRWVGTSTDIDDHYRMTAALKESEARFRAMADGAPVLIWLAESDGHRSFFNQPWLAFTGRDLQEVLGDRWIQDLHPDDQPGYLALYTDHIVRRVPFVAEYRLRRADGAWRWMLSSVVPRVSPDDGSFAGLVGSAVDITERREGEERQALLMQEVDHRTNNVLASVQAVLTRRSNLNPDVHLQMVQRRVACLARAHSALARNRWVGADLAALLVAEVKAAGMEEATSLHGPEITLAPHAVQPFALTAHELIEYISSRSVPDRTCTLNIAWSVDVTADTKALRLTWCESRIVKAPIPKAVPFAGAALGDEKLLITLVRRQLRGSLEWEVGEFGDAVRCTMTFPQHVLGGDVVRRSPPSFSNIGEVVGGEKAGDSWLGLFRAAFEATEVGFCVTDEGGRFLLVNPAFCQTVGYTENELLSWHFSMVIAPAERAEATRVMSEVLASEDGRRSGKRGIKTRSGTILTAFTKSAVLSIPGAERRLIVSTIMDINGLRLARRELQEALTRASAADAAETWFRSAVLHGADGPQVKSSIRG